MLASGRCGSGETFAPVAKFNTIRCIFARGVAMNFEMHQIYIKMTLKSSYKFKFEMSDLGKLHFFLGVHFRRDGRIRTISMHQRSYNKNIWSDLAWEIVNPSKSRSMQRPHW